MTKAAFIDRDGVINQETEGQYVNRPEDFILLPAAAEAIELLAIAGYKIIVVTNQRGVALGYLSRHGLNLIHDKMRDELGRKTFRAQIDSIYYCPHDIGQCECRKPEPGMLLQAKRRYDIDMAQSVMFGNSWTDHLAAKAAGVRPITIPTNAPLLKYVEEYLREQVQT